MQNRAKQIGLKQNGDKKRDYRRMNVQQLTKDIFRNPENHFHVGECNECGYPGHWGYACKLLPIKWKKEFTQRARNNNLNISTSQGIKNEKNNNNNKPTPKKTPRKRPKKKKGAQLPAQSTSQSVTQTTNPTTNSTLDTTGMPPTYGTKNKPTINTMHQQTFQLPPNTTQHDVINAIAHMTSPYKQRQQ